MGYPERFKAIRKWYGLTQRDVAQFLDIKRDTYSKREIPRGKKYSMAPTPEEIVRFAKFYGISTDWLLGLDTDEPWGTSALDARRYIVARLPEVTTDPLKDHVRFAWLLDQIAEVVPDTLPAIRPDRLCLVSQDMLEQLRSGRKPPLGTHAARRVAEYCGLPDLWIGAGDWVDADAIPRSWLAVLREVYLRGLEPDTIRQNMEALIQKQQRQQKPVSQ